MYQSFIKPAFTDIKTFVLDTLFPVSCLSCGAEGSFVCVDCKMTLKNLERQRCIVCQKATPYGFTHTGCQTPYGADGLISFYDYHDAKMADVLIAGKYNFIPGTYKILAGMMANKIKVNFDYLLPAYNLPKAQQVAGRQPISYHLCPIPLHPTRLRWRGFNQAEVLCQELSGHLSMPCTSVLVRCKMTKVQKDVSKREDRLKNMRGAFELKKDESVRGKSFILVDDVTTTGTTLQEAAQILKRNGAAKVICVTVARD